MKPEPIKISEMIALSKATGMIGSIDEYIEIIQAADMAYLKHITEKSNG